MDSKNKSYQRTFDSDNEIYIYIYIYIYDISSRYIVTPFIHRRFLLNLRVRKSPSHIINV